MSSPGIVVSAMNWVLGFCGQTAIMGTWCGGTTVGLLMLSKRTLAPETRMNYLRAYGLYFGVTRLLWMNGWGRFLRFGLTRNWQEKVSLGGLCTAWRRASHKHTSKLLSGFLSSCLSWHLPADRQVVAWSSKSRGGLSPKQTIFLNEPHGVGNGILSLLYFALHARRANPGATLHASPVVLGSKNVCLVPFLAEFCWIFAGTDGFEFAENVSDIKRALASNRDITLVPSGFSTIGTGGVVDWKR